MSRIPPVIDQGTDVASTIGFIDFHFREHRDLKRAGKDLVTDTAGRYACGFPLPDFQRGHVWSLEQSAAFIESAWLGLPLGTFNIHEMAWMEGGAAKRFSGWLIDGQQRLLTLQHYWNNQFRVFDLYWCDLEPAEQRRFMGIKFSHSVSELWDEGKIRDLYNRLSFGGTPHEEFERA